MFINYKTCTVSIVQNEAQVIKILPLDSIQYKFSELICQYLFAELFCKDFYLVNTEICLASENLMNKLHE